MGMFEDVKAIEAIESKEAETMKRRFAALNEQYQAALDKLETIIGERVAERDFYQEQILKAKTETAFLKKALAMVTSDLRRVQHQKAAITRNRDFWKRECEAVEMTLHLTEIAQKTTEKETPVPQKIELKQAELPFMMAAAIGK